MRRLRGVAGLVVVATVGVACSSAPPQTPPASAGASPAGSTPSPASRLVAMKAISVNAPGYYGLDRIQHPTFTRQAGKIAPGLWWK